MWAWNSWSTFSTKSSSRGICFLSKGSRSSKHREVLRAPSRLRFKSTPIPEANIPFLHSVDVANEFIGEANPRPPYSHLHALSFSPHKNMKKRKNLPRCGKTLPTALGPEEKAGGPRLQGQSTGWNSWCFYCCLPIGPGTVVAHLQMEPGLSLETGDRREEVCLDWKGPILKISIKYLRIEAIR